MPIERKTILVIEDERPLQEAIKIKLEKSGFEVLSARSVAQALGYLEDVKRIDGVWLDHYLLGAANGLDFVARVKAHKAWTNLPIFVVSNTASPEKVRAYLHLGVDKYYTKTDYRLEQIIADMTTVLNQ